MKIYDESVQHVDGKQTDNLYKRMRLYMMMEILGNVVKKYPDVDIAECGCWNGHSTHMSSLLVKQHGFQGQFHVFDSFEGACQSLRSTIERA
jgi:hypothetical protein